MMVTSDIQRDDTSASDNKMPHSKHPPLQTFSCRHSRRVLYPLAEETLSEPDTLVKDSATSQEGDRTFMKADATNGDESAMPLLHQNTNNDVAEVSITWSHHRNNSNVNGAVSLKKLTASMIDSGNCCINSNCSSSVIKCNDSDGKNNGRRSRAVSGGTVATSCRALQLLSTRNARGVNHKSPQSGKSCSTATTLAQTSNSSLQMLEMNVFSLAPQCTSDQLSIPMISGSGGGTNSHALELGENGHDLIKPGDNLLTPVGRLLTPVDCLALSEDRLLPTVICMTKEQPRGTIGKKGQLSSSSGTNNTCRACQRTL